MTGTSTGGRCIIGLLTYCRLKIQNRKGHPACHLDSVSFFSLSIQRLNGRPVNPVSPVGRLTQQSALVACAPRPSRKGDSAAARTASVASRIRAWHVPMLPASSADMHADPLPKADLPGRVSRCCSGGDRSRLKRLISLPCQIRAPTPNRS